MIFIECKPDAELVKIFGIPRKEIHHVGGKSEVCRRLRKFENQKGLVDEDPFSVQPRYVREECKMWKNLPDYCFKILKDRSNNKLIVLCPRLEEWVLKAARRAGIDVKNYGLPDDGDKLHEVINMNIRKFKKLLNDLKDKSDMLKTLGKFIKNV